MYLQTKNSRNYRKASRVPYHKAFTLTAIAVVWVIAIETMNHLPNLL